MREIQMNSLIHEKRYHQLLGDITGLCENARSVLVETYWQIGKRIVEEEQSGNVTADHGTQLIERLAEDLTANFGSGFSKANVYNFRRFYLTHKSFQPAGNLSWSQYVGLLNYIDTPELGTAPGEKASRYVRRILKANPNIVICTHKHDKYTRYLADVFYLPGARSPKRILQEGIYLNQELLDKSLATVF